MKIELIGSLHFSEVLIVCVLPFLLIKHGRLLLEKLPLIFIGLGLLWLFSLILSDVINDTLPNDYARGWAKVSFTIINFSTLYMLLAKSEKRICIFVAGMVGSTLVSYFIIGELSLQNAPWKFGLGTALVLSLTLVFRGKFFMRYPSMQILILFLVSVFFMMNVARSEAGITFVFAVFMAVNMFYNNKVRVSHNLSSVFLILIGVLGSVAILEVYSFAAIEGYLGADAADKHFRQISAGYGLLLGGRLEVVVALEAIMDSPIVGYGSWAKNTFYSEMLADFRYGDITVKIPYFLTGEFIPRHSILFGTWVEAGILGAVFWIAVLAFVARIFLKVIFLRSQILPLAIYVMVLMYWHILFSPYGGDRRYIFPFFIILIMHVHERIYPKVDKSAQSSTNAVAKNGA